MDRLKLLVTGGAGFIGTNFIYYMLSSHDDVEIFNIDCLSYAGHLENLDHLNNERRYKFFKGNICDSKFVNDLFDQYKFDMLVNFAAESHVDRSIKNSDIFMKTNIMGTHNLLKTALKFGIKRFHQVSTDEVYGSWSPESVPGNGFKELDFLNPSNPYSSSKAAADLIALSYFKTYGMPVTISRCSNNYGPYQFPEKLIPLTILNALRNKPIGLYGSGKNVREWLYVVDHCKAIDLILANGKTGEIYNISGTPRTNLDVVNDILHILNKPTSLINFVEDRLAHDKIYSIDSTKIRKNVGWHQKYDFESGLKRTIDWYLGNLEWLNKILGGSTL